MTFYFDTRVVSKDGDVDVPVDLLDDCTVNHSCSLVPLTWFRPFHVEDRHVLEAWLLIPESLDVKESESSARFADYSWRTSPYRVRSLAETDPAAEKLNGLTFDVVAKKSSPKLRRIRLPKAGRDLGWMPERPEKAVFVREQIGVSIWRLKTWTMEQSVVVNEGLE